MAYLYYNIVDRGSETDYPGYHDLSKTKPNLMTYLDAVNKSQPIIQCQYELTWSRWPRTIFFAKNITIPGMSVNTIDINHAGFTIPIPTHVTYESNEVSMTILADKEGFHYYDIRNMVLQTGHPLIAGDPRSTVGNQYGVNTDEDRIEVRLRNRPEDETHHHWIFHNFKPKGIGEVELTQDGSSFVEFELTGTFTHISYDCGKNNTPAQSSSKQESQPQASSEQAAPDTSPEDQEAEQAAEDARQQEEEWMDEDNEQDPGEIPTDDEGDVDEKGYIDAEYQGGASGATIVNAEAEHTSQDGQDSMSSSNSVIDLKGETSQEAIELAEQCSDELGDANAEFKEALEKIKNMPSDENFTPQSPDVVSDTLVDAKVPKPDQQMITDEQEEANIQNGSKERYQGDRVTNFVESDVTLKSQAQQDAYNAALQTYKQKTSGTIQNYSDAKAQMEAG